MIPVLGPHRVSADFTSPSRSTTFRNTRNLRKQLTPVFSRFCLEVLSIQRFWLCSLAKLLISKDRPGRGRYRVYQSVNGALSPESGKAVSLERHESSSAFASLSSGLRELSASGSRFCPQLLSIQRSWSCSPAKLMIPKDHEGRGIYLAIGTNRTCHA